MHRPTLHPSFLLRPWTLAGVLALAGCPKAKEAPAPTDAASSTTAGPVADPDPASAGAADAPRTPTTAALLAWLDPDATSIGYVRNELVLDGERLSTIFGLPPNLESIVKAPSDLQWGLDVLLGVDDAATINEWFDDDMLVMRPRVANDLYVVRRLERPREELKKALGTQGAFSEAEGFEVFRPRSAFPFNLVFLTDDVVAFVPQQEIGSGLSPLTAARDLPASPAEGEILQALNEERPLSLLAMAAGPMTHLDLDHDVGRARVSLRRLEGGVADGEVAYQMLGVDEAKLAVDALDKRTVFADSERMKEIARKVAFTSEGDVVTGRLQIPATDADVLIDPRLKAHAK